MFPSFIRMVLDFPIVIIAIYYVIILLNNGEWTLYIWKILEFKYRGILFKTIWIKFVYCVRNLYIAFCSACNAWPQSMQHAWLYNVRQILVERENYHMHVLFFLKIKQDCNLRKRSTPSNLDLHNILFFFYTG